jgi:hypothetical protein
MASNWPRRLLVVGTTVLLYPRAYYVFLRCRGGLRNELQYALNRDKLPVNKRLSELSARAHLVLRDQEVAGSNPVAPIFLTTCQSETCGYLRCCSVARLTWTTPSWKEVATMPQRIPQYCLRNASSQGYAKINGRRIYLGVCDTPESHRRCEQEIARLEARSKGKVPDDICVGELILLFQQRHVPDRVF